MTNILGFTQPLPLFDPEGATGPPPARRWLTTSAGLVYVAAWVVGLAVHTGPAADARPADVLAHFSDAGGAGIVGSLLVHGVAAGAFLVVAHALARFARRHDSNRTARAVWGAAIIATAASAAQVAVAVRLSTVSSAETASGWFGVLNHLDGIKLLAMAMVVAAGVMMTRRHDSWTWLGIVSAALAASLVVAGAGFSAGIATVTVAAVPALLLLFLWVPTTAFFVSRR